MYHRAVHELERCALTDGECASTRASTTTTPSRKTIKAVYLQFAFQADLGTMPANLLVGARYENTDVTSTCARSCRSDRDASGRTNNDFRLVRRWRLATRSAKTADYNNLLPSLDFDIGLTDSIKGRFSYSKTIARAKYGNLFAGCQPERPERLDAHRQAGARRTPTTRHWCRSNPTTSTCPWSGTSPTRATCQRVYSRSDIVELHRYRSSIEAWSVRRNIKDQTAGPRAQAALNAWLVGAATVATASTTRRCSP